MLPNETPTAAFWQTNRKSQPLTPRSRYGGVGLVLFFCGYSPINGDPTDIDEAIAMTDGDVYKGQVPDNLTPLVGYIMRPDGNTPEPSALGLLGTAGAVAGAAALRRRRRSENKS